MAVATGTALAIGGAALLGAVAGSKKDNVDTSSRSTTQLAGETDAEAEARRLAKDKFSEINTISEEVFGRDATANYLKQSVGAQTDLAGFFKQLQESGGLPNAADVAAAGGFAEQIYKPQQVALQQSMEDQANEFAKLQARLGRGASDPILQAKLRTGFMRQQADIEAQKGAYSSDLSLKLPGQRLQYAIGGAQVMQDLASQAFQNRAALFEMGRGVQTAERDFRLASADRSTTGSQSSGGGLKGGITGFLSGAAAGGSLANAFGGFGGATAGASAANGGGTSGAGGGAFGRNIGLGYQKY